MAWRCRFLTARRGQHGNDIAETPEEIAVSILAEMIAVRRGVAAAEIGPLAASLPGRLRAVR